MIEPTFSLPVRASRDPDRISTATNLDGLSFATHYVYRIESGGKFYVGVRTCHGDPSKDSYFGSGAWAVRHRKRSRPKKTILSLHETRQAAEIEETRLIAEVIGTPGCLNKKRSGWWKYRDKVAVNSVNS